LFLQPDLESVGVEFTGLKIQFKGTDAVQRGGGKRESHGVGTPPVNAEYTTLLLTQKGKSFPADHPVNHLIPRHISGDI
jgi:hypothetical protein